MIRLEQTSFLFLFRLWSIAVHRDHFVRCLSVRPSVRLSLSVCMSDSHTFLVVTHKNVSQATHAFLRMLPKAQMHNGDQALSVVNFSHFRFSPATTERDSTNFDRKQYLSVLYQVCIFRADRKIKMAAPGSGYLRRFQLLLWNLWMEFNETWEEARSQCPLPGFVFRADRKNKMAGVTTNNDPRRKST